jgi:chromosome segregation ATPase
MGSTRDFLRSALTDALLPVTRQLLEDVVMELLTDRQVPSRSDFQDLRDLCNSLRGQVSASGALVKRAQAQVDELGAALAASEAARAELARRVESLEARLEAAAATADRPTPRRKRGAAE